ncbi:MAG: Ldh family oxidoreductase [Spirochaetales bacterium]|nr:Ldh family oxidoreductase [Spirochaetales bacterium]
MSRLVDFYTERLTAVGIEPERARRFSQSQVEVHGFGVITHGIPPLQLMLTKIRENREFIKSPEVQHSFGALVQADCSRTPAVEPVIWGAEKAASLADVHGIGFVSLTNAGWVGTMGYHFSEWARKGYLMIGGNQMSHVLFASAHGGKDLRFNTNPLAVSFPLGDETYRHKPVVADFSSAAISMGKTSRMARAGTHTPEKLFVDRDGNYSADPQVTKEGGAIIPFGGEHYGFRGTALALLIEALTAAAGAVPANPRGEGGQNVHITALKIDALGGRESYGPLMEELMDWVRASEPVSGGSGVRYPGERGWAALEEMKKSGVYLDDFLADMVREEGFSY